MGWLVGSWRWGKYGYLPHRCGDSAVPVAAPRQDRLGCTMNPMIALPTQAKSKIYGGGTTLLLILRSLRLTSARLNAGTFNMPTSYQYIVGMGKRGAY